MMTYLSELLIICQIDEEPEKEFDIMRFRLYEVYFYLTDFMRSNLTSHVNIILSTQNIFYEHIEVF